MKKFLKRCTFALLMCGSPLAVMAEVVEIFSENFSSFGSVNLTTTYCENWELSQCINGNGNVSGNVAIKIRDYAKTPALSLLSGEGTLSFKCATPKKSDENFRLLVTIEGGGSFDAIDEEKRSVNITVETSTLTEKSISIYGGTSNTKIKFKGYGEYESIFIDDVVVTAESTSAPTFSLEEGYYKTAQTVTMNCATDGATIYYTDDGTTPTSASTEYTGAITVSTTKTIKAVAIKGGKASGVTTVWYYVGDYFYANAFTNETGGYKSLTDGNNTFIVSNLDIGRSAILTFRMAGRESANELNLVVWKDNVTKILEQGWTPAKDEWTSATCLITLPNDGSTVTLTISSVDCNIDDVLLVAPPTMALAENVDNGSTLVAYNGKIVDVATTRTLRANIWNTLCLPFDVNRSVLNAAIGGGETMMRTYSSYADNVMTFASVGDNDVIAAGTPFLLKTSVGCTNPVFRAVTIAATEPQTVTKGNVSFKGIFSPTALQTDGSDLFIGTDNCLYSPGAGTNTMNGLRAYIHTTAGARIGLAFDDETQAIGSVDVAPQPQSVVYTLQGQRTTKARRGLYIQNGKKVILK